MSSFLKQFASTITNEQDTYDGYYEINILNNEPSDQLEKIIVDRTNKYKNKTINTPKSETKNDTECVIFNDIIENINDIHDTNGIFKIKTNNSQLKTCTFFIETRHILAFKQFHDCIKSISLQRRKKYYYYMISIMHPPKNTHFELFNYKIKYDKNAYQEQQYNKININYSVKRTAKNIFDNDSTSYTSTITKIKTKLINHKNKNRNIIYDNNLIWIETFEIHIQSLFDSMCNNIDILIPVRSLKNKNLKLLTIHSNLLKWGNISHVKQGKFTFIKWSLAFIKGLSSHTVIIQLSLIANNAQICEDILTNKQQQFANHAQKEYIFDSQIKTKWKKQYFTISGMKIDKYFADKEHVKSCWIRQITQKKIVLELDDEKDIELDEKEEIICFDMDFINTLKTMKAAIITLDRRATFLKMKKFSDILWRKKEENNILYINSEIYIDVIENERGGIVNIKNNISGLSFFKFCIKMKDELLLITSYHSCIFLVEYKLKKTTISKNEHKCYAYIYFFYVFAMPYGTFELFKFKRLQNKKQSLITLKCNKYVIDNESEKDNKNENEWRENYRLTLNSHFSADCAANDVLLTIPVFINNLQKGNIKIKNMSSSLLQKGKLKYIENENCLLWTLTNFAGKHEISRNIQFKLSKMDKEMELKYKTKEAKNNVLVFGECEINSIEIEDFCISGIIIAGCKCIDDEELKYGVWIRYNTVIDDKV